MQGLLNDGQIGISLEQEFRSRLTTSQYSEICSVETREGEWKEVHASPQNASRLAYTQLWLFVKRNFPLMDDCNPTKDPGDPLIFYNIVPQLKTAFAKLASRLGYESPEITSRKYQDCDGEARTFIHYVWSLSRCICDISTGRDGLRVSPGGFDDIQRRGLHRDAPTIVIEQNDEPIPSRCGRPYNRSYVLDRPYLYLEHIYMCDAERKRLYFTSFGVKWDTFLAFFGDIAFDGNVWTEHSRLEIPQHQSNAPTAGGPLAFGTSPHRLVSRSPGPLRTADGTFHQQPIQHAPAFVTDTSPHIYAKAQFPSDLPASTVLHSRKFTQTQDLNIWMIRVSESERSLLYYNLCNGWTYAFGEHVRREDLRLVFRDHVPPSCYMWSIDENRATFLLPSDAMNGIKRGLYFFGKKGVNEVDNRYLEQVVLLIARYYPSINVTECLSMLPMYGRTLVDSSPDDEASALF